MATRKRTRPVLSEDVEWVRAWATYQAYLISDNYQRFECFVAAGDDRVVTLIRGGLMPENHAVVNTMSRRDLIDHVQAAVEIAREERTHLYLAMEDKRAYPAGGRAFTLVEPALDAVAIDPSFALVEEDGKPTPDEEERLAESTGAASSRC